MLKFLSIFALLTYSVISYASLPSVSSDWLYTRSDLIVVGKLTGTTVTTSQGKPAAVMKVFFSIKGSDVSDVLVCDDDSSQEGLRVTKGGPDTILEPKRIYYLRRIEGCYIGSFGYKSYINFYGEKNCIYTALAYQTERHENDFEPLETFIEKLTGVHPVLPSFLTSGPGECDGRIEEIKSTNDCKP